LSCKNADRIGLVNLEVIMINVILQMAGLIVCGIAWRLTKPAGLDFLLTRKVLTTLVYYLLLPALVLSVLWKAELGGQSWRIALSAASGVSMGLVVGLLICRLCKNRRAETGAMLLATAFPNATYLGLPALEATFGPWARSVAIQYDLFGCVPLLYTVGMLIGARFGEGHGIHPNIVSGLLRIPPLWAAVLAVLLNNFNVPIPDVVDGLLGLLQRGVVPLMLFSLGLSLEWKPSRIRYLAPIMPLIVLRLFVLPAFVLLIASNLGLTGEMRAAVVLEAAMPSMVIGIVICDRFNLDVTLYATAVTVTTALSMVTLPLWYQWLL